MMLGTGTTKRETAMSAHTKAVLARIVAGERLAMTDDYYARWGDGTAVQTNTLELLHRRGLVEEKGGVVFATEEGERYAPA